MKLRFIHEHLAPLAAILTLLVVVCCWFGTTLPVHTPPAPPATPPWQLPSLAQQDIQKSITTINARNLWGILATTEVAKPPEWKVVGIATAGAERFVWLAYEGKPLTTLKIGDTLPDETTVVQIEKDRFFVMTKDKKKLTYGLYKNDPSK
jgi:hypothetical protein